MTAVIDGYCHCGVSKYLPLRDVRAAMEANGVQRAVLAQHLGEFDNSYLASVVRDNPREFSAVALVDAGDPGWPHGLARLAASGHFRGLRIPRETLLATPAVCRAAADHGLVLVIDATAGIAECLPELKRLLESGTKGMTISHFGYPRIEDGKVVAGRELFELAPFPEVRVMFSGQSQWLEEPYSALDDFTREVVDVFGPDRVIWGSNYPVCGDVNAYRRDLQRLTDGGWGLTPTEVEAITHHNAEVLWFS